MSTTNDVRMNIYLPRMELRPYVRYFWTLKSDRPFSILTFPIGCPQIIFHRKTPLYIPELDKSQNDFTLSGQVNFPAHIRSDGNLDMLVAVFYPHTLGMFIDTPPSAFYNQEISGYDLENDFLNETAACIFDSQDDNTAIEILENRLLKKVNPTLDLPRIGTSIESLMHNPATSVKSLADNACLCQKQFVRIFRDQVGMNPKEYARVVRFQKALRSLQCGSHNFAAIAADCGFADQSHFIREFRKMSGLTPKSFQKYCKPYSDLFTFPAT